MNCSTNSLEQEAVQTYGCHLHEQKVKDEILCEGQKRHEYFSGEIVSYDGLTSKYGACIFHRIGEIVNIEPND